MGLDSLRSFSFRHRDIYIIILSLILFLNILNISVLSKDTIIPVIGFFDVRPYVQIKDYYVNITCITRDNEKIQTVNVTILYPNNTTSTEPMLWSPKGKYIYNSIYNILGNYSMYIKVKDNAGNVVKTSIKHFWITLDKEDKDSDGIPDFWEKKYNLDPEDSDDAVVDSDYDGYTNYKEYQIGTNPIKDIFLQNAVYRLKNNARYIALSIFLFILIVLFSFYGIGRRLK
jgi:hypothetical protein